MEEMFDFAVVDSMLWAKKYAWSYGNLTDGAGRKTGIIYGLVNLAVGILKSRARKVIFAWEGAGRLWRQEVSPAYKAGRTGTFWGQEAAQITEARRILAELGCDEAWAYGFEADDIAGAVVAEARGTIYPVSVLLMSADEDWAQLVGGRVRIAGAGKSSMGEDQVEKALGLHPSQVPLMKAVVGCKSDGIEGVPRIPRRIARGLIGGSREWKDFEAGMAVRSSEKWPGRIMEARERLRMNFTLATIRKPATDQITRGSGRRAPDKARMSAEALGMAALARRIGELEKKISKNKEARHADT